MNQKKKTKKKTKKNETKLITLKRQKIPIVIYSNFIEFKLIVMLTVM